jgi:acetyl-CoA carboxylase / biotin carboxylase 1
MEMYADEESRGGVLEPEGIVGIKFRKDRQLETMARLDPIYGDLKRSSINSTLPAEELAQIKAKMAKREQLLLPIYNQISLQFADLHDRAGRMQAKETIRQPLQWKNARRFFYWRLRRRLNEESILKKMVTASIKGPGMTRERAFETLRAWTGISDFENNDRAVAEWYEVNKKEIAGKIEAIRTDGVAFDVATLLVGNKEGGLRGIKQVLEKLSVDERENVLKFLRSA